MNKLKGVMYDLDGTIISSEDVHKKAWQFAAKKVGTVADDEFIAKQRGRPENVGATILIGDNTIKIDEIIKYKYEYLLSHIEEVKVFKGFVETAKYLIAKGLEVWVCTSVSGRFVKAILQKFPELSFLEDSVVYSEHYKKGKPNPEPLILTMSKMGLNAEECLYIGDAYNDYLASKNAEVKFIYFCPDFSLWNSKIPKQTLNIKNHSQVLKIVRG